MTDRYKVNVVASSHTYSKANELFIRERESMNLKVIPVETAGIQALRALKRNEIVCILGDRDPTEQGIEINFFGKPCRFPQGPARFAISTGAPILPAFALRRTNDSFLLTCGDPINVPQEGDKKEKVRQMTQKYAKVIEEIIRWHPEEWTVFYNVWKEEWKA
jgi:KDO2-lipid IV(A) lauroyltransferase